MYIAYVSCACRTAISPRDLRTCMQWVPHLNNAIEAAQRYDAAKLARLLAVINQTAREDRCLIYLPYIVLGVRFPVPVSLQLSRTGESARRAKRSGPWEIGRGLLLNHSIPLLTPCFSFNKETKISE